MTDDARDFTTKQRKTAASAGAALPDGSFPIKNRQDLKNAITALGRAKDPAKAKRHIIKRARALGLVSSLPEDWDVSQHNHTIDCRDAECTRVFLTEQAMADHAEAVHTFNDQRQLVQDALKDAYGQKSNYEQKIPGIYVWIRDQAADWVVFEREGSGTDLWKVGYVIDGENKVTFGEPVQVVQRTIFEPVKDSEKLVANA